MWERFSADLPDVDGLRNYQPPVMSRVYAGDGRLMAELATERRIFVPYTAIPEVVKQAFVSAEDQNFWTHPGVDPLAIARAGLFDLIAYGPEAPDRRLHDHPAGRQEHAAGQRGVAGPQGARGDPGDAHRADAVEAADPRTVSERDLSGAVVVWRRRGGAGLFQQAAGQADAVRGGVPRRAAEGAEQLQSVQVPRRREGAARLGARPDGRGPRRSRPQQAAAAKAEPIVPAEFRRPQPIPGADWFAEEVRRAADRAVRRRRDDAGRADGAHQPRSGAAGRRREDGARRADGLRPQAGRLARPGRPSRRRTGAGEGLGRAAGAGDAAARHAAGLAARRGAGDDRHRGAAGLAGDRRRARRNRAPARCRCPISPGRGR